MIIGHYAVGLAGKTIAPKVSLGWLLLASLFIDLLWPSLLLLDLEKVRIVPDDPNVVPLVFESYPISHSLLAVAGWAVFLAGVYILLKRERFGAVIVGMLVLGHWGLDVIVHKPDLPLYPGSPVLIGLNGWSSLPVALAIEVPMFLLGVWLYTRTTEPLDKIGRWGFVGLAFFLSASYAGSIFGPLPPDVDTLAWTAQVHWLVILSAFWLDRHRSLRAPKSPLVVEPAQ